jgi:hypothetical protein
MTIKPQYLIILLLLNISGINVVNAQSETNKVDTSKQVIKLKATIVGSKEQPRFLSIVPWKKLKSPVTYGSKVNSVTPSNLGFTSPTQLKTQQQLTQYLQGRYVKKLALNK